MNYNLIIIIFVMIIIFILLILLNLCESYRINFYEILDVMKNEPNYNFSIGALPYNASWKVSKFEVERLYLIVDFINKHKKLEYTNNNRQKQNKMTIKLLFFKKNGVIDFNSVEQVVKYANKHNILVGIASFLKNNKKEEMEIYLKLLKLGYKNIFITLASYHEDIDESVDLILKNDGIIRLVKGWYNDGDIKDWNIVTKNYLRNAKKLVESNKFHILATHDFKILKKLYNNYGNKMDNIEVAFFYFNKGFVKKQLEKFPYIIKYKQFYKPYGNKCKSLFFNIRYSNIKRIIQRRIFGK